REWQSKKQELLNSAPYLLTLNRGRLAQYPLLEERLVEWIETLQNKQMAAKQLVRINEIKEAYSNIVDFRFSNDLENVNEENIEESNANDISGEEYEETEVDNDWE
ncbi:33535_t:CDS:2, partial [Gigaspora margarita]